MIVNNTNKWVFIHNPKVAGSSVRKTLLPYNESHMELWHQRYIPELQRIVDMSHLSSEEFEVVTSDRYRSYFKFGFVRDPYARLMSALKEYSAQNGVDVRSSQERRSQFILEKLTPVTIQYDWNFSHFRPQFMFFYRGNRRVVDFVGRFHRLNEDFKTVCALLNVSNEGELPIERDRGHSAVMQDPLSVFGEKALEHINRLYAMDWMLFAPYLPSNMVGTLPSGTHFHNVQNVRTPEGRQTFYGEPPGLSLGEKVGFLTTEVERLRARLGEQDYRAT